MLTKKTALQARYVKQKQPHSQETIDRTERQWGRGGGSERERERERPGVAKELDRQKLINIPVYFKNYIAVSCLKVTCQALYTHQVTLCTQATHTIHPRCIHINQLNCQRNLSQVLLFGGFAKDLLQPASL